MKREHGFPAGGKDRQAHSRYSKLSENRVERPHQKRLGQGEKEEANDGSDRSEPDGRETGMEHGRSRRTAVGASVCCVGALLPLALGIGGTWIGNLTAMERYRPKELLLQKG
jgi:hypothetical protein